MFDPSGSGRHGRDIGAELLEHRRRDRRESAVRAVDGDAKAAEVGAEVLENVLGVPGSRVLCHLDRAAAERRCIEECLDRLLVVVGELVALRVEELEAVVLGWVVRRGDHDAEILCQQCHGRRRQDTAADRDSPRRHDACDERLLEGRTGAARVATDEDPPARRPHRRGSPEPLDEIERQRLADNATNAIGSEVSTGHGDWPPEGGGCTLRGGSVPTSAWRTAAPCAPCAGRPSYARPGARHA